MDLTLRDVFYWLIDTPIWEVTLWFIAIPAAILAFSFLVDLHAYLTLKPDGSEKTGGKFLFWFLIIVLWVIIVEGLEILVTGDFIQR